MTREIDPTKVRYNSNTVQSAPEVHDTQKGDVVTVPSELFLEGPEYCREHFGIAFDAFLKAIIKPDPTNVASSAVAILELEDHSNSDTAVPANGPQKTKAWIDTREKPFVAVTQATSNMLVHYSEHNWSLKYLPLDGMRAIGQADELTIGRAAFGAHDLGSPYISAQHAVVSISPGSEIIIADISTNGTSVIVPQVV